MSKKFKDYYDIEYSYSLAEKIKNVYKEFDTEYFIKLIEPTIEGLEFTDSDLPPLIGPKVMLVKTNNW